MFRSLTLNGETHEINKSFGPITKENAFSFGVHFQTNGNRRGDAYYVWVDDLKFTLW